MARLTNGDNAVINRFCEEHGVARRAVLALLRLIDAAVDAQTDWHNGDMTESAMEAICKEVDEMAETMGFGVDWNPGLYPQLVKGGKNYMPPYVSD